MSDEPIKPQMPSDEEIEARLSKIKENLTTDLDDADERLAGILDKTHVPKIETDEFDDKLKALEAKAQDLKEKRERQKIQAEKEIQSTQESNAGLGMGMTIAYVIIGVPVAGGLIGMLLNKLTGSTFWLTLFGMGGVVLGLGFAVYLATKNNQT
jgi:F0F1-type ATP synthase assembly protein I